MRIILLILFFSLPYTVAAQTATMKGRILSEGLPLGAVNISLEGTSVGTFSDDSGNYFISVPADSLIRIYFRYVGFFTEIISLRLNKGEVRVYDIHLEKDVKILQQIEIYSSNDDELREQVSMIKIDPIAAGSLPSPFNEFNRILATLPGVVSNNELSSAYSVRGGNFDENQVYVNDIPVYRPFLISAGQQEGLSFVNPDLVGNIMFSSGGWQAKYGDKLSSNLNIEYKKPESNTGSISIGLLGGSAHMEGRHKNIRYLAGVRHKNSRYLLNTLETEGQYLPNFTDVQALVDIDLSARGPYKTSLTILNSFAVNNYFVQPESRTTEFGNFQQSYRLRVGFDGQEQLNYHTWQTGIKLSQKFSNKLQSEIILSYMKTMEREYMDVEGFYRLCDLDKELGSATFNECLSVRGLGSFYNYARNKLMAQIITFESRNTYRIAPNNKLEYGVGYSQEHIRDEMSEYAFTDSADYVRINRLLNFNTGIVTRRLWAFVQNSLSLDSMNSLTYGVRLNYWDLNGQFLVSPRVQYAYKPLWKRDVLFKAAVGMYQQPPFYRELRNFEGDPNTRLKAQSSIHFISGMDYIYKMWGRDFKFVTEAYYKHLYNVIPYDIDNVRIRYHAENSATAYAKGVDFRVNGEFIKGAESWFSLGIMSTKENIEGDGRGYIRRPTDQRITLGIYFEDHLPNDPSLRMYLNLQYGSGLPFGPPERPELRGRFRGGQYRRVDLGFRKLFAFQQAEAKSFSFKSLWISAEILNILGSENPISYLWIQDIHSNQFAVPNALSARFLNLRLIARY